MGILTIDNSSCKASISKVLYSIVQRVTIKNGCNSIGEIKLKRYVHKSTDDYGVEANEGHVLRRVGLELTDIKYAVKELKVIQPSKGGKTKKVQTQEMDPQKRSLLSSMAPTTHSKHITNEYFLTCFLMFDGVINGEYPKMTIPLTILPMPYQSGF